MPRKPSNCEGLFQMKPGRKAVTLAENTMDHGHDVLHRGACRAG